MRTENIYSVYVHKNLKNEKYYVGATSMNPSYRWNNGKGYKFNTQMWKDIKNSDWNKDWVHGILGKFDNKQDALKYEAFLIAMLDSVRNGYNSSKYGSGDFKHHKHSEETKKKISEAQIGKVLTEESKKKMSDSHTGKVLTEEHKKKISQSMGVNGILQYSKDGIFIAEYPSVREAERQTGCSHGNICSCCKGNYKSTGGFVWKYKEG